MKRLSVLLILLPGIAFAQQAQPQFSAGVSELAQQLAIQAAISASRADEIATLRKQIEALTKREEPKK